MVVFLGIQPGQVPEEPQPEVLDPFRDWQAACSAPNRLIWFVVCLVYEIRRIFRRHQVSKASRRLARVLVTVHAVKA